MSDDVHYDEKIIAFLEDLWGDGFLSPGGADEVRRVLDGVAVYNKSVIDIVGLVVGSFQRLVTKRIRNRSIKKTKKSIR